MPGTGRGCGSTAVQRLADHHVAALTLEASIAAIVAAETLRMRTSLRRVRMAALMILPFMTFNVGDWP